MSPEIAAVVFFYVGNLWWTHASPEGLRSLFGPDSSTYIDELRWPSCLREAVQSRTGSMDVRPTRANKKRGVRGAPRFSQCSSVWTRTHTQILTRSIWRVL